MLKSYSAAIGAAIILSACNQASEQTANQAPEAKPAVLAEQGTATSEVSESQRVNAFFRTYI